MHLVVKQNCEKMKRVNPKDKWKTLVQRALNQDSRMDMIVLNEWQKYSKPEINLLIQLNDPEISLDSIKSQNAVHQILQNGSFEFIEQCLITSMGVEQCQFNNRFLPLFALFDKWIVEGLLPKYEREHIVHSLLLHLIENEDIHHLKLLLSNTSDVYHNRSNEVPDHIIEDDDEIRLRYSTEYPEINSDLLIRACEKNNFELIQALILAGYR